MLNDFHGIMTGYIPKHAVIHPMMASHPMLQSASSSWNRNRLQ